MSHYSLNNRRADVNGNTPLMFACQRGASAELVKVLLQHGANPNCRDKERVTPMHMAALSGNAEIIRLLAEAGGNCCGSTERNAPMPPLHLACKHGKHNFETRIPSREKLPCQ
jgi:ankyrin repeat protein